MRGAEGNRDRGSEIEICALRDRPSGTCGHGAKGGVRAVEADGYDLLAEFQIVHVRTDFDDFTGRLIAHNVRPTGKRTLPAVQNVAALDAHRFDLYDNAIALARRIWNVFVTKDIRLAIFVVDRCL